VAQIFVFYCSVAALMGEQVLERVEWRVFFNDQNSTRATHAESQAINVPLQRGSLHSNRMKWVVKYFIPLGGNPHRQMDLYHPLGG
jgi:hypothetical protein